VIYFLYPPVGGRRFIQRAFLDGPGRILLPRLELMSHDEALVAPARPGTYIFAGVNNLLPANRSVVAEVWLRLSQLGSEVRLLNNPLKTLGRYDLLRTLHANGTNDFRARLLLEPEHPLRFPVFIRHRRHHTGALTRLLRNEHELEAAADMLQAFEDPNDLLVVEFCDTSDDEGVSRMYGVCMIGERVVPRYVFFSRGWVLKVPNLVDERKVREEREFLETNPHEEWVREVFRVAGIDYGRVDYGVLDGRPQAWEINTNPGVWFPPASEARLPGQELVARRLVEAFEELDRVDVVSGAGAPRANAPGSV
jgi:hypothetical protein